jgi:hypothetical protein
MKTCVYSKFIGPTFLLQMFELNILPWIILRVSHLFSFFVLSYYMYLRSEFRVVMSFAIAA